MTLFRRARPIHFVYAERFREAGSTVMRGSQLARIAREALGERADVSYSPLDAPFSRSTLFLTKGALKEATPELLTVLKERGNRLLFDVVDEVPPPTTNGFADLLVSASISAYVDHMRDFPRVDVALVNHHVDPRVEVIGGERPADRLRVGYFGELVNAVLTPTITEVVDPILVDTSRTDDGWVSKLGDYNMHYAVRLTRAADHHKPFLKGFTAAHCHANILIQRSQAEAVNWLGDDYPFLLDGEPSEASIRSALERAQEAFLGPEWNDGLAIMEDVRERTSSARIGAELRRALA